ncbi:MAG: hypothetical protein WBB29_08065 [Geitlerinemataceae cyanobacterium]
MTHTPGKHQSAESFNVIPFSQYRFSKLQFYRERLPTGKVSAFLQNTADSTILPEVYPIVIPDKVSGLKRPIDFIELQQLEGVLLGNPVGLYPIQIQEFELAGVANILSNDRSKHTELE